jgi:N-acetylmuramoyl-L-alanine amidase
MKIGPRTLIRSTTACALACLLLAPVSAFARSVRQKKQAARVQFDMAERMREALEGKPESDRSRGDYQKVMEAYRKVYYTAPTSMKADASVLAVAELLDDQGRVLNDPKSFKDAIGQYVFLRREYPGSKHRAEALFAIAEIYRDDLNDPAQAKATFEDFLKHYPANSHAQDARKAIAEIDNPSAAVNPFKAKAPKRPRSARNKTLRAAEETPKAPAPSDDETAAAPAPQPQQQDVSTSADAQPHRVARLTSIRHWSTPDYTRVAIDLEQEVKYQAGRVPHPDRIFFDLYGTRLAADLVGKSFEVDAGFLHKIRVAQYKLNMARVVLDVDDVAEYSAFLLPNPYRLIIDIHGKLPPTQIASNAASNAGGSAVSTVAHKKGTKSASPETPAAQPADDVEAGNDVTVTKVSPADSKAAVAKTTDNPAPSESAETRSSGARGQGKDRDKDKERVITESPAEVAKAVSPKVVVDDTGMDDSGKTSGKPTSGPTFEAISPKESSRNRKKAAEPATRASVATTTHTAAPTASGERSLIRALGLKIGKIVVDAGHGGHDTGTIGPNGLEEKDLVLDVALKLGKLLEDRLGAEVVYTRDDDTFIPLETRTAIANKEQADLFISIHANSSSDPTARGVETYYLNFTSRADALEVAARENAVSEKSIHELQDLVKKIALKEKIGESREFAADVQRSLYAGLSAKSPSLRNRGVKKAPFVVLIGANMPSILAEISFVSNPDDARKLMTNDYRKRIAESLYKGVSRYVNSLSGVKVASRNSEYKPASESTAAVASAK